MWSNRNSHTPVGMQNGAATLEDSLAVSNKTKQALTIQVSNHITLSYSLKGEENLCPHKKLHVDVYSGFIHNHQNLEATKSFSR